MIILECIKDFTVFELDKPHGNLTGAELKVLKGSLWKSETDQKFADISYFDILNKINAEDEYTGEWICDVDEKAITNNFKLLLDSQENQND